MTVLPGNTGPLFDTGNQLLSADVPASLQAGMLQLGDGRQHGLVTIRTPDVTLSVTLTREGCENWIRALAALRDMLPSAGSKLLVAQPGAVVRP